jgi:Zn finger protein HypA/HybF involved in hydrogenase expression
MARRNEQTVDPEAIIGELTQSVEVGVGVLNPGPGTSAASNTEPATPQPIEGIVSRALNEAANLLLGRLDSSVREYAIEVADTVLKIPRWQLLLGAIVARHEQGALQAPTLDPSWRSVELVEAHLICARCSKEFEPDRFGQRMCKPCGAEARKESITKLHEARARALKGDQAAGIR